MSDRITIAVAGMTCNACAAKVKQTLEQLQCKEVRVDFMLGEASFAINQGKPLQPIVSAVSRSGYPAQIASAEQKAPSAKWPWPLIITAPFTLLLMAHMWLPTAHWLHVPLIQFTLTVPVFAVGMYTMGRGAWQAASKRRANMDTLIALGVISSTGYSVYGLFTPRPEDYLFFETAASIVTLVLLGHWIEAQAVAKTSASIKHLLDLKPLKAKRLVRAGLNTELNPVMATELVVGDKILLNTGDEVPVDCTLMHGNLELDEASLTGESLPVSRASNDRVYAGTMITAGSASAEVVAVFADSAKGKVGQMVRDALSEAPPIQRMADKVGAVFTPFVLVIAVFTALTNALFIATVSESILRAVAVLVIACPCAIGLATPAILSVALGAAARKGIIVKRASAIEMLTKIKAVVFDKTGTLTKSIPSLGAGEFSSELDSKEIEQIARSLAARSSHPLSLALHEKLAGISLIEMSEVEELIGSGVAGTFDGNRWLLGKAPFSGVKAGLYLTIGEKVMARWPVHEELAEGAAEMVFEFRQRGIATFLLSGDHSLNVEAVTNSLKIENWKSEATPETKREFVSRLGLKQPTMMVGDGLNDAAAMATSLVGVAVGAATALTAHSASVVLLNSRLSAITDLLDLSSRTTSAIKVSLSWALGYNLLAIPLAATGFLSPTIAALSMAFSDLVVVGVALVFGLQLRKRLA